MLLSVPFWTRGNSVSYREVSLEDSMAMTINHVGFIESQRKGRSVKGYKIKIGGVLAGKDFAHSLTARFGDGLLCLLYRKELPHCYVYSLTSRATHLAIRKLKVCGTINRGRNLSSALRSSNFSITLYHILSAIFIDSHLWHYCRGDFPTSSARGICGTVHCLA